MSSSHDPLPLTPASIREAHKLIAPYIHHTPLLTCATLSTLASGPLPHTAEDPSTCPHLNLYFKAENLQKIGAFKARGAHHALIRLLARLGPDDVRRRGVITHSSGNHAQALALAAKNFNVTSYIVMPGISTPSKIEGTRKYTEHVIFSGSTSVEREEVVAKVMAETGAVLVPPYDDGDVVLGQGTVGFEMEGQFGRMRGAERASSAKVVEGNRGGEETEEERKVKMKMKEHKTKEDFEKGMDGWFEEWKRSGGPAVQREHEEEEPRQRQHSPKTRAVCSEAIPASSSPSPDTLDAIIAPIGGGGLLGGLATYFSSPPSSSTSPSSSPPQRKKALIFGAEPSFSGANDAELGLRSGKRIEQVSSLTIADGCRTPVGLLNWDIISDSDKVAGIYSVTEQQIKDAMRLVFERMKMVVEPSGCVGLAVVLYNVEWRKRVAELQKREEEEGKGKRSWDVGVVFSGGNTTMESIVALYGEKEEENLREEGKVGINGETKVEDVAG